jgi:hypothetical protein
MERSNLGVLLDDKDNNTNWVCDKKNKEISNLAFGDRRPVINLESTATNLIKNESLANFNPDRKRTKQRVHGKKWSDISKRCG